MAVFTFPSTTPIAPEQAAWARAQLRDAMESNKTRFKELVGNAQATADAEAAVLLVASRKREAYERAKKGAAAESFGWVLADPGLAAASAVLDRLHVMSQDLDALPLEIAQIVPVDEMQAALF